MSLHCNEHYETARLIQVVEDEPRLPFINAVRKHNTAQSLNEKAKLVEVIVRTSRTVTDDDGLLPDDIQQGLMVLVEQFRDFGPTVVSVPVTYGDARNLIKTFFF